jgi:glycosyltransferase involved in cell wall biosynthesis
MGFGKPVLALARGGALETVVEGLTGEFFDETDPAVLADGIRRLRENLPNYDSQKIIEHAQKFSKEKFIKEIKDFIERVPAA